MTRDGEGDQDESVAGGRRHVIGRHQQARRRAQAGDADAVGNGEDLLHIDADQPRALSFLGDGANRLAGIGLRHEQAEDEADRQGGCKGDDLGKRQERRPDLDDVAGIGHVDRLCVAAEEQ